MFCVSPDRPANSVKYWTGRFTGTRFDLAHASGPFSLDTGDVLYAPTVMGPHAGAPGRVLLWGWLQERDAARVAAAAAAATPPLHADHAAAADARTTFGGIEFGSAAEAAAALSVAQAAGYSGCLSCPRVLSLGEGGRVQQAPAHELAALRRELLAQAARAAVPPGAAAARDGPSLRLRPLASRVYCSPGDAASCVPRGAGDALDVRMSLRRSGPACVAAGIWRPPAADGGEGLLLLWMWTTRELWATRDITLSGAMRSAAEAAALPPHPPGGPPAGRDVTLRILFDGSAVEAFTGPQGDCPGRALATRLYRGGGAARSSDGNSLQLVAVGEEGVEATDVSVWSVSSIWAPQPPIAPQTEP
jgi:hypothetical protein